MAVPAGASINAYAKGNFSRREYSVTIITGLTYAPTPENDYVKLNENKKLDEGKSN